MIATLTLALCLCPAQDPSPDPPPAPLPFTPGEYLVEVGTCNYQMTFHESGAYQALGDTGGKWVGVWKWDKQQRVLTIRESSTGENLYTTEYRLDDSLSHPSYAVFRRKEGKSP